MHMTREKKIAPVHISDGGEAMKRLHAGRWCITVLMLVLFMVLPQPSYGDWNNVEGVRHFRVAIDHTRIDEDLADFPVLIHLAERCGIDGFDASAVFDALPSGADRKKIAFYTENGARCQAEIERWDAGGREAWIWVRVPDIRADRDTELTLYYDAAKGANTQDIGNTGEAAARGVWDHRFVGVWHMGRDPLFESYGENTCIPDATTNARDGMPAGITTCDNLVDGMIGAALAFSATAGERVDINMDASFDLSSHTIEAFINRASDTGDRSIIGTAGIGLDGIGMAAGVFGDFGWKAYAAFDENPLNNFTDTIGGGVLPIGEWTHLAYTFDGSLQRIYENGTPIAVRDQAGRHPSALTSDLMIGNRSDGTHPFDGMIDEVRISAAPRSAAWIRAAYHAGLDDLVRYAPPLPADAVNAVTVNADGDGTTAVLDWSGDDALAHGAAAFHIYAEEAYFADVSDLTPIGIVDAAVSAYEVTELTPGIRYYFAVVPVEVAGNPITPVVAAVSAVTTVLPKLNIALPFSVTEGDGILTGAGTVFLPFAPAADLVVNLSSNRPDVVAVPSTTTIQKGKTSAGFDLTVTDDFILGGNREAIITAAAAGWMSGSETIGIWDNGGRNLAENFSGNDNDLANKTLTFTPAGSSGLYSACIQDADAFPTDPAGGVQLKLSDDAHAKVSLSNGAAIPFFGIAYSVFYIGSNGYITFGKGDSDYTPSLRDHYNRPRISALFADLWPPRGGTITWIQLADRAVVTYHNIPQFRTSNSNSFQIEMFFDGVIRITWLKIDIRSGLIGLSDGSGTPADFIESDFSESRCRDADLFETQIAFSSDVYAVVENEGTAEITVRLSGESAGTVIVDYALFAGTAEINDDYADVGGTLVFAPGETVGTIVVPITDDNVFEADETLVATLNRIVNAVPGVQTHALVTIIDDDPDNIPPEEVVHLTVKSFEDRLVFSWGSSPNTWGDLAGYKIYFDGDTSGEFVSSDTHAIERLNLSPAAAYDFRITAVDLTGNESTGNSRTGITLLDNPHHVTAEPFDGSITLRWDITEPSGFVDYYAVYQNSEDFVDVSGMRPVSWTGGTSRTIGGLANGKTYYFAVTAVNLSGGEQHRVMAVRTVPVEDIRGPDLSDLMMGGMSLRNGLTLFTDQTVTLKADDRSGIDRVEFFLDGILIHADDDGTDDYSAGIDTAGISYGEHTLSMDAYDAKGNRTSVQYAIASSPGLPFPCFQECAK